MLGLRTKKSEEKYQKHLRNKKNLNYCPLCSEAGLKKFKYWKILKNNFPYDKIAKKHHMIVPIRHITENKLNQKELLEYKKIKQNFINKADYTTIIEATDKIKSLPSHFHLHLIILK